MFRLEGGQGHEHSAIHVQGRARPAAPKQPPKARHAIAGPRTTKEPAAPMGELAMAGGGSWETF